MRTSAAVRPFPDGSSRHALARALPPSATGSGALSASSRGAGLVSVGNNLTLTQLPALYFDLRVSHGSHTSDAKRLVGHGRRRSLRYPHGGCPLPGRFDAAAGSSSGRVANLFVFIGQFIQVALWTRVPCPPNENGAVLTPRCATIARASAFTSRTTCGKVAVMRGHSDVQSPPLPASTLETLLWRTVSQNADLNECLPKVTDLLGKECRLLGILVRRLDESPTRLVSATLSVVANNALPTERLDSARTDLAGSSEAEVRRFLAQGHALWLSDATGDLRNALFPVVLPLRVWAAPLTAAAGHAGVALFIFPEDVHIGTTSSVLQLAWPSLATAFKNDQHFHDVMRLREALKADRDVLLSKLGRQDICEVVVGEDNGLSQVMAAVHQVARTDAPVLILGETGSGKEVIARAIHERSARGRGPVVRVNCGAIPTDLVDSELFGHERGSFTGAVSARKGWFERADGGTLFLDEVGELPAAAQVRLLRVLQDGTLERVGGHQTVHVDVRIVAATNRDLDAMVRAGAFREDLWYRLSVFPIHLPALRERLDDLPALVSYFTERAGKRLGNPHLTPTASDLDKLRNYSWPGNVRELSAVIERAAIIGGGKVLDVAGALGTQATRSASRPPSFASPPNEPVCSLDEAMRRHIGRALEVSQGRIEGPGGAAKLLDINPHTLRARMRKLGIQWARFRE